LTDTSIIWKIFYTESRFVSFWLYVLHGQLMFFFQFIYLLWFSTYMYMTG